MTPEREPRTEPGFADARGSADAEWPSVRGGGGHPRSRRDALRITAVAGLGVALTGSVIAELLRRGALHRVSVTRARMGTTATITVLHEERAPARAMVETAFAEIERLERILSRQQYGTAVHRLNQFGRLPEPPAELVTILDHARHYSLLTEGAFDITVAPLIDLYAMRFVVAGRPPSESEIRVLRERISWKSVTVDGRGVTFEEKGTAISVDGIAKGFVVDRTCTVLAAAGADQVLVGAGGDIAAGSAESWRVAVRDPHDAARDVGIVRLCGNGIASSGDYMQAYTPDRAHHHIVDPRTGRSPEATSGVTVIAPTAMAADVISTSAFVLGPREGIALLRTLPDAEGMIVTKSGETVTSEGFASFSD